MTDFQYYMKVCALDKINWQFRSGSKPWSFPSHATNNYNKVPYAPALSFNIRCLTRRSITIYNETSGYGKYLQSTIDIRTWKMLTICREITLVPQPNNAFAKVPKYAGFRLPYATMSGGGWVQLPTPQLIWYAELPGAALLVGDRRKWRNLKKKNKK